MTRHRLDLFSLLSGLVLTGIALVALLGVSIDVAGWVWPAILIVVGVVVLATVLGAERSADEGQVATGAGDDPTDPERDTALASARAEVDEVDRTSD